MSKAVICILKTQLQAETVVTRLRAAGLQTADISLVFLERSGVLGLARDRDSQLTGGRAGTAVPSGPVGGVLGMLSGIGIVTIPGAGLHITAGPMIAALSGGSPGAVVSGVAEGLIWMGVPMTRARLFEEQVKQGHILLAIRTWHADEHQRALVVLREARAEEVSEAEECIRIGGSSQQKPLAIP